MPSAISTVKIAALAVGMLGVGSAWSQLLPGDADRGEALHQQHCDGCHAERFGGDGAAIYLRDERMVNTVEGLIGQVERCNSMIGLGLGGDQLDDLVTYLAERRYRFED